MDMGGYVEPMLTVGCVGVALLPGRLLVLLPPTAPAAPESWDMIVAVAKQQSNSDHCGLVE